MSDMDMITITRAQFHEAADQCLKEFAEAKPDRIPEDVGQLFQFAIGGWAKGLEYTLFGDDEEDVNVLPFN